MQPPEIQSIDHIVMQAADLAATIKFYTENSSTEDSKFHSGNGWEELEFKFSSAEKYNRLVFFIDGPGNTAGEFYIKSIIQSNSKIQIKK